MSDDLISRQEAIDAIERLILPQTKGETVAEEINRVAWRCAINCAEELIVHLPSAQPEPQWIPCSERLPKYGKNVLITNDKGNVSYGRFRGVEFWQEDGDAHWHWKHNTTEHVLAWMPLPDPWKGEER